MMRRTATGLIVLMAALFLWSGRYLGEHPGWGYLHAFAEAAMVGGLADWFAVTALFRHPLGLPIPHTAIIPENKDRIADTMAGFLRDNFLTPAVVGRRMGSMNLAGAIGSYLADPKATRDSRIQAGAGELAVEVLESLDPDRLGTQVRSGIKTQLGKLEVAPLLGGMLEAMIADGRHKPLIDKIIRWAGLVLEDNEAMVREMVHRRANAVLRFTGLDERLANSVIDGLYKLLAEVLVDPEHPLRNKIEEGLEDLARGLRDGRGVFEEALTGHRYEGDWVRGERDGEGEFVSGDGAFRYSGTWKKGRRAGRGRAEIHGSTYEGEWKNDAFHGTGFLVDTVGNQYEGEFHQGRKHGSGTQTYADGSKYSGEWRDGARHGTGHLVVRDGSGEARS